MWPFRQHQKQLLQEGQDDSSSPVPPTQLDMDQHWNDPAHKNLNVISQPGWYTVLGLTHIRGVKGITWGVSHKSAEINKRF